MADVVGTNASLFDIEQMSFIEGRGLSENDVAYARKVVVLSEQAKTELFGDQNAEGEKEALCGGPGTATTHERRSNRRA